MIISHRESTTHPKHCKQRKHTCCSYHADNHEHAPQSAPSHHGFPSRKSSFLGSASRPVLEIPLRPSWWRGARLGIMEKLSKTVSIYKQRTRMTILMCRYSHKSCHDRRKSRRRDQWRCTQTGERFCEVDGCEPSEPAPESERLDVS
jgi:hypothetical protein